MKERNKEIKQETKKKKKRVYYHIQNLEEMDIAREASIWG